MSTDGPGKIPPPFALAMVICEAIWRDPSNGKRFILGCFSSIAAHTFPAIHPTIGLYVALSNGHGKIPFKVQLVDTDEERPPLWAAEGEIEIDDPRAVAELDFMMGGVSFPEPGEYRMQFFACGEHVIERRLLLVQIPQVQ